MKTVQLAHGEEVVVLVKVTLLSLDHLIKDNPIGFYELVMKCRNPQHSIWGDQQGKLQELSLEYTKCRTVECPGRWAGDGTDKSFIVPRSSRR
jgi:hypothetical protein